LQIYGGSDAQKPQRPDCRVGKKRSKRTKKRPTDTNRCLQGRGKWGKEEKKRKPNLNP